MIYTKCQKCGHETELLKYATIQKCRGCRYWEREGLGLWDIALDVSEKPWLIFLTVKNALNVGIIMF